MDKEFELWKKKPDPKNLGSLLRAADPDINKALQSYGGSNPALKSRARILAIDAFRTYDPKKGTKLSTHLMTQMQPLMRYQRDYSNITRVPERAATDLYTLQKEEQRLRDQYGRDPSDKELADSTGMSFKRINHVRKFAKTDISESNLLDEEGGVMMPGVQKANPEKVWIEYVHHDLGPVDQKILEWRTGFNGAEMLENQEIAKRLNLTPGAVSQRAQKIAMKLAEIQGIDG